MKSTGRTTKVLAGGALVLAGFGTGAVDAVTGSASAATDTVVSGVSAAAQKLDPTKSVRSDEHLLSVTTAAVDPASLPGPAERPRRALRPARAGHERLFRWHHRPNGHVQRTG